ncbi:hypothetical protein STCU_05255 [Strigomonas culicis]|uniref:Uncharacterized protein n=1 Tax=Strigomonas culicis TaxID=28005 RepID=S9UBM6_9TRYP|nr:hypothetical protein STCU_05255 [Strigomonas culicis]|eukprot:EPY28192.1 hypothetical protein STCU_05255 [Strigomonas culicis]
MCSALSLDIVPLSFSFIYPFPFLLARDITRKKLLLYIFKVSEEQRTPQTMEGAPTSSSAPPTAKEAASVTTITVALCGNPRKHHQSFDALVLEGEEHNKKVEALQQQTPPTSSHSLPAEEKDSEADSPWRESLNGVKFRFLFLNYHVEGREMVLCPPSAPKGFVEATSKAEEGGRAAAKQAAPPCPVPAHEVDVVLHKVASFGTPDAEQALVRWCKGVDRHRARRRQPPVIMMDPLEKVGLLTTRSMLCQLLDKDEADGRPLALIPRTFLWQRSTQPLEASALTPVGLRSFALPHDAAQRDGLWWIAKPEEGTGPAFTHHLVMWHGTEACVAPAVAAQLPPQSNTFVIQEFYASALPVVVKVYCIGPRVFIKVNPTIHLLATLRGSTASVNVPVQMDSQNRSLFSKEALTTEDGTTYAPAPSALWDRFFAPGTAARANVAQLAANLSSESGLGLQLFGFDILLLPRYAAHAHQRDLSKGIGYAAASDHASTTDAAPHRQEEAEKYLVRPPSDMFDLASGAATPLLMESVPIVIDMNFFPGYSGMPSANTDMMHLIDRQCKSARQAASSTGSTSKKRRCKII